MDGFQMHERDVLVERSRLSSLAAEGDTWARFELATRFKDARALWSAASAVVVLPSGATYRIGAHEVFGAARYGAGFLR